MASVSALTFVDLDLDLNELGGRASYLQSDSTNPVFLFMHIFFGVGDHQDVVSVEKWH